MMDIQGQSSHLHLEPGGGASMAVCELRAPFGFEQLCYGEASIRKVSFRAEASSLDLSTASS